jgi:hypothetical protein
MKAPLTTLLFAAPALLLADSYNFTDTEFSPPDWSANLIYNTTASVADYSPSQVFSAGNPGSWRETVLHYDTGSLAVGQIDKTFVYTPFLFGGPITSVSFSYDFQVLNAGDSLVIGHGLVVTQLDKYYVADYVTQAPGEGWVSHSGTGLTAGDFTEYNGTGHPDFSAPLTFGYLTANGTAGGLTKTDSGIDNFSVTFTTVPEPPAFAWAGVLGGGMLAWSLIRRRSR